MLIDTIKVFDDVIAGTTSTWLTSSDLNERLGEGDRGRIQAVSTQIVGSPSLTIEVEHSGDSENWTPLSSGPEIDAEALSENESVASAFYTDCSRFIRYRISLTGTGSPACRLQVYASLRAYAIGVNG
jgi:hypothetical protein